MQDLSRTSVCFFSFFFSLLFPGSKSLPARPMKYKKKVRKCKKKYIYVCIDADYTLSPLHLPGCCQITFIQKGGDVLFTNKKQQQALAKRQYKIQKQEKANASTTTSKKPLEVPSTVTFGTRFQPPTIVFSWHMFLFFFLKGQTVSLKKINRKKRWRNKETKK